MNNWSGFLELVSYKSKEFLGSAQKSSLFLELFSKLSRVVKEQYSESSEVFQKFCGAIQMKTQLLELIKNRYIESAAFLDECFKHAEKNLTKYATSADPEVLREASEFSERFRFARKSVILDIESFLVFSRVLLDYVPWMLQPFLRGHVAKQEPSTVDFRKFCEWFRDNPNNMIDEEISNFLLEFYEWFMEKLRNPRNDLVVHLERRYTLDRFSSYGTIIRFKYFPLASENSNELFKLTSPVVLFDRILKFLKELEDHFLRILTS